MRLDSIFSEVCPNIWQVVLNQPVKLEEPHLKVLKVFSEHVPEAQLMHNFNQNTKSLLLWHLKQKGGDQKALTLTVPVLTKISFDYINVHKTKVGEFLSKAQFQWYSPNL